MLPQIHIFGREIGTYALCGVIGILVAGWVFCRLLKKRGQSDDEGVMLLVVAGLGSVLGSHLLYGLTNMRLFRAFALVSSFKEGIYVLGKIFGGGVFYGGLIGGLIVALMYIKKRRLALCEFADCGAICIPLFHSFARVGCFFAGCCYGIESNWGFASSFNPFVPEVVGIRRFPTPLLEAVLNLILFFFLFLIREKKVLRGALIFVYLLSYAVIRFSIEFLRGDAVRGIWLGLSTSQWISIGLLIFSLGGIVRMIIKKREEPNS